MARLGQTSMLNTKGGNALRSTEIVTLGLFLTCAQLNRFPDFHHTYLGPGSALLQLAIKRLGRTCQKGKSTIVHGNRSSRRDQLYRFRGTRRPHCEMIADANEHHVDVVKARQQTHVGKQIRITGMVNRRAAANRNDKATWRAAIP